MEYFGLAKRRPREQREIEKIEVKVLSHYE